MKLKILWTTLVELVGVGSPVYIRVASQELLISSSHFEL